MGLLSGKELFFLWCHGTRDHERGAAHGFNSLALLLIKVVAFVYGFLGSSTKALFGRTLAPGGVGAV